MTQQFPVSIVKSCREFHQNLNPGFQFSIKNWVNFLRAGEKIKIENFIGWFCLKEKLPEQKLDTVVSCPDSKELWKVSAKSKPWFPTQNQIQISLVGFV